MSQNLVPNPSFETTSGCGGNGQMPQATGWNAPPGSITIADLYTPCGTNGTGCSNFNTLNSMAGCSNACDGNNYTGQIGYYTSCTNCREYLQRQLSAPLVAGVTYFLSFQTKLAPYARYAVNRMGMYVSTTAPPQPSSNQPILVTPQIEAGMINDKVNWTTVSGTYTAVGGENYVTIGIFYNNASLTIFNFGSSSSTCLLANAAAYYLVDNVWIARTTSGFPPACAPNSTNCNAPLPIELVSFEAESKSKLVELTWKTASEKNNDFFTLEKSNNGEQFQELARVKSKGNDNGANEYEYNDDKPFDGISYYRLKQTDFDGTYYYSDLRVVDMDQKNNGLSIQPNPAEIYLELKYNSNLPCHIEVVDILGNKVIVTELAEFSEQELRIDVQNLNKGIYFLNLVSEKEVITEKFIKN